MKVLTPIKGTRPSPTLNREPAKQKREVDIEMTNKPQPGQKLVSRENRKTVGDIHGRESAHDLPGRQCLSTATSKPSKMSPWTSARNEVIAMIGPSGCGKSTFIRCLNRMNDTIDSCRVTGEIKLDGGRYLRQEHRRGAPAGPGRAWCFKNRIPFPSRFTTTSPMDRRSTAWPEQGRAG